MILHATWDTFSSDGGEPLVAGGTNRTHGTNHGEEPACFDELLHKRTHCICNRALKRLWGNCNFRLHRQQQCTIKRNSGSEDNIGAAAAASKVQC